MPSWLERYILRFWIGFVCIIAMNIVVPLFPSVHDFWESAYQGNRALILIVVIVCWAVLCQLQMMLPREWVIFFLIDIITGFVIWAVLQEITEFNNHIIFSCVMVTAGAIATATVVIGILETTPSNRNQ